MYHPLSHPGLLLILYEAVRSQGHRIIVTHHLCPVQSHSLPIVTLHYITKFLRWPKYKLQGLQLQGPPRRDEVDKIQDNVR